MSWKNLSEFVHHLESRNELIRVRSYTDPVLEIAEITDRFSKLPEGGKAILFENTGSDFPVLTNMMGSDTRIAMALGVSSLDEISENIADLFSGLMSPKSGWKEKLSVIPLLGRMQAWFPRSFSGKAPCQEVIMNTPDLRKLPVMQCWPFDGGRFITLPMVHTKDPVTGVRNVGMYRMQVLGPDLTGMHWHRHKTGARHFESYKALHRIMPVAVTLGGDPACIYAATAPMPENLDEYLLAGFLRKKPVEMVKCLTQNLEVPAFSEFVIEGYVDPSEPLVWEGPFGDHTGFYSAADWYPAFHVTCITHRSGAVWPATLVGIPPQEDAYMAKATEKIFSMPIRYMMQPELRGLHMPVCGTAHNLALVSIEKSYPGQGIKTIQSLWGAGQMMMNKIMLVADASVNLYDYRSIVRDALQKLVFPRDLIFSRGPLDILDHASPSFSFGSKLGIDMTRRFPEEACGEVCSLKIPENLSLSDFKQALPSVCEICLDWLKEGLPIVSVSLKEKMQASYTELVRICNSNPAFSAVRVWIWLDEPVNIYDPWQVAWMALSNTDPSRDISVYEQPGSGGVIHINAFSKAGISGRDWPNVAVMSEKISHQVDTRWSELFPQIPWIPSPSDKTRNLHHSGEAMVKKPE